MAAPNTPQDIVDRLRRMERQVRELTGRMNIRPALNTIVGGSITVKDGGDVRIVDGGYLEVYAPGDVPIFGVGLFGDTGRYGTVIMREDGTGTAIEVGGNDASTSQMVRLYPRGSYPSEPMVMDDAYADGFLGRPYVPIPMAAPMNFSSTSWQTVFAGNCTAQHAVLYAHFSVYAPSGNTAEARLMIFDGGEYRQMGDTIQASGTESFSHQRLGKNEHGMEYNNNRTILIQARRTAGTSTCTAWCQGIVGVNSIDATEA